MATVQKIMNVLFEGLASRQKEVLAARFGLDGKEPRTLEAIGKNYGVTRERIRQIEASALAIVRKNIGASAECSQMFNEGKKYLKSFGGIAPQDDFIDHLASSWDGLTGNHLAFFIDAAEPFYFYAEDEKFRPFYYLDKESLKRLNELLGSFVKVLREKKEEVLSGGFGTHFASFVKGVGVPSKIFSVYIAVSKKIGRNPYGDRGLAEWPFINPRTIRDRIYLVLKKEGKPVHFQGIADLINKAGFEGRKALAPTVHNELIKDKRFVLVGRGIYALAEHGYEPGIARDVIRRILKSQGPLTFQEIVSAVAKERFFKPNTILANLQNKNIFERTKEGTYRVREA